MNRIATVFWMWLYRLAKGHLADSLVSIEGQQEPRAIQSAPRSVQEELRRCHDRNAEQQEAIRVLREEQVLLQTSNEALRQQVDGNNRHIERQAAQIQELQQLATTDTLTGLTNRRGLDEGFKREFGLLERTHQQSSMALIAIDIDHFKSINDAYGHPAGDAVLVQLARILEKDRRPSDIIARAGGEEFFVVLPQANSKSAYRQGEKIRERIAATTFTIPLKDGTREIQVTVSCGVAAIGIKADDRKRPVVALDQLYAFADQALYEAKENGRNQVVCRELPSDKEE